MSQVGIDAIHFSIPKLAVQIADLANKRNIEFAKLNKGLGLNQMAILDSDEDAATLAAEAIYNLVTTYDIKLNEVGRIYLGTESALDGAKPTATYALEMLQNKLGENLNHIDVVDLTFACIGGVDALQNSMDWIRANPARKAIVVASDQAKYELASSGEYTQGGGAVAMLLSSNPKLIAFDGTFGVSTSGASDFFKPRRAFEKAELLKQAAQLLGVELDADQADALLQKTDSAFWGTQSKIIHQFSECPVFDGPYSNNCYQERIAEALESWEKQTEKNPLDWRKLIFHLPYAFQGRRMFTPIFVNWMIRDGRLAELEEAVGEKADSAENPSADWIKKVSKSPLYKSFIAERIATGEKASSDIGNMYTASIFMSLISSLVEAAKADENLVEKPIGFFAYGSGSKAKSFEGIVQAEWKTQIEKINLFETLETRQIIDFETYEKLHREEVETPLTSKLFSFINVSDKPNQEGYRFYKHA